MHYKRRFFAAISPEKPVLPFSVNAPSPFLIANEVLILHSGAFPTLHYYIEPRCQYATYVDTRTTRPSSAILHRYRHVVLVRHVSLQWSRYLRKNILPEQIISYFMDDDLPDILEDRALPHKYAFKTWLRFRLLFQNLKYILTNSYVSTVYLAQKYNLPDSHVLPPLANPSDLCIYNKPKQNTCVVFYHGTASHIQEIYWLKSIITPVLINYPQVIFEIFGNSKVKSLYKDLLRVRVVHPMSWSSYKSYSRTVQLDIGLAPLLDSSFNFSRTYVKFFDITCAGAVGIYSNMHVYNNFVNHDFNGILVENEKHFWIEAITRLVENSELREEMHTNALKSFVEKPSERL